MGLSCYVLLFYVTKVSPLWGFILFVKRYFFMLQRCRPYGAYPFCCVLLFYVTKVSPYGAYPFCYMLLFYVTKVSPLRGLSFLLCVIFYVTKESPLRAYLLFVTKVSPLCGFILFIKCYFFILQRCRPKGLYPLSVIIHHRSRTKLLTSVF